jgi:hypothetical protein
LYAAPCAPRINILVFYGCHDFSIDAGFGGRVPTVDRGRSERLSVRRCRSVDKPQGDGAGFYGVS